MAARTGRTAARDARIGAWAAAVASLGDLLLLYVGNAPRPELALPAVGRAWPIWLWLGGGLGVVAIPLYALGYRAAARLVAEAAPRSARLLSGAGAAVAVLGALIHGLTTVLLRDGLAAGAPASDPLLAVADSGLLLPAAWSLATLLVCGASAVFAWHVGRGGTTARRALGLANPALLTAVLAVAGLPWLLARAFLTPAAPNLAHLLFFAACARTLRSLAAASPPQGSCLRQP